MKSRINCFDDRPHSERHYKLAAAHACSAESPNAMPSEIPQQEIEARARLIAADKDLLEACKALVEGFDAAKDQALFEMMGSCGAEQEGRRIQARAAIQKAQGQ